MKNYFETIDRANEKHWKAELLGDKKEERALLREVAEGKRKYIPHPMEWMAHVGPWKNKRIDFSRRQPCIVGSS